MIIYGTNSVHLKTEQSRTAVCPQCQAKGALSFSVFSRHAHIFWIPLFPIGKVGGCQCKECEHVMKPKEMPDDIRQQYNNLKGESSVPKWQFSGLLLLVLAIGAFQYSEAREKEKERGYITHPVEGDVYEYKTDDGNYSTMRVDRIDGDTLYISPNDYATNKKSGIPDIDKDENYLEDVYGLTRKDILDLYDAGDIYDVNRQ